MANNGKTSSSLSESILDAFEILAQAEVKSAQFDKTITGIIVSCEDEATGRYKVQYQDAIFYAYSTALDVTYNKGVSVQVKIPNNDFSGRKMIIGTVEENGIDYGTIVEDPLLRYEYVGIDCIGSMEQNDLSSYWNESKNNIIVYDRENNIDNINLNEQMINDNIQQSNSVLLGATFKTNIPDIQRFKGDYGIKYTLTFNDISNVSATIDRYYIVDIDKMGGDPYSYDIAVDQIVPFDIDSENFLYIKRVELFAKNFIYQDDNKPADIFISNLRFQLAYRIPDEEFAGTALNIITPDGNYFIANEGVTIKTAIAQLRIKGKLTDNNIKNIQYYWFIEDLRVDKTSNIGYNKYGGRGWKCLNEYNVTEGEEDNPISVDYITGENVLNIKKDNSKSKETKYKCVIIYNNQVLSKEFYFINYDIQEEVKIISSENPNFIDSIGSTTLTCVSSNGVVYQWAKVDTEGGFETLRDTTAENTGYENAVRNYNNLQAAIENKTEPDNEINIKLLETYQSVIKKYDYIERRKENQIINLQASSIYKEIIYKCQAFDEAGNSLGIGTQLLTNSIKSEDEKQQGNLIINNGNQVFKYNAKGIAPTSEQFDEPQVILPFSFTLRTAEGIEIPDKALRDTDITWIVPTKNTMIKSYLGSVVSHDEDLGIEIYNGKSLGYTINDNYYANKDNNEIELQVKYQGLLYVARTNLYFTKDGDNGTNGTEYVLKILPDINTIGRLKTVKAGQTGKDWLRVQLWYNGIKIYEGYNTGNAITGKTVHVTWSMVGDKRATHNISVTNNGTNPPLWIAASNYISTATDIAKARVEYDGIVITATTPIIYSNDLINSMYKVSLKNETGFTHVIYSEDGRTPNYDSHTPFEIEVYKLINGQWGNITGHNSLNYNWSTVGNLKIKNGYTNADAAIMFEPVGSYNSEETNNAIICTVQENSTTIGTLHIPIHFLLNTYGHSAINEWDGNSIQLDADGNTMLLSPQAGFGKKESDNSYTGVLLGTVKDYTNNGLEHTGMFGYSSGTRTMFLNSENGAAIFGSIGGAQVVIDPSSTTAKLYSNDFYKNYDSKTGLPSNYSSSNENGKGALIDLSVPQIRWGNGNFKVDVNGHITAKGGGTIAGWNIDDTALFTGTKNSADNVQIMSSDFTRTVNGVSRTGLRLALGSKFAVSNNGTMYAGDAIIGTGTNKITIGKSNADGNYSALYSGNKSAFGTNANGFYIGTDGISLGSHNSNGESKFQVTSGGILTAREGTIGGWTITRNTIAGGNVTLNANGNLTGKNWNINNDGSANFGSNLTIASNGNVTVAGNITASTGKIAGYTISGDTLYGSQVGMDAESGGNYAFWAGAAINNSGNAPFRVGHDGSLVASKATINGTIEATTGKIGGWTIDGTTLKGGNVVLNSNGNLSGTNWYINNDGSTKFGNLTVDNSGNIKANGGQFSGITVDGSAVITKATIKECTVENSCTVPASTITGVLDSERIPSLSASKISSGTMSASRISGGTLNISTSGGGYLKAGTDGTKNVRVSGLTVGSDGLAMGGNSISNVDDISINGGISANGGTIYLNDSTQVSGNLNITGKIGIDGTYGINLSKCELSGCDFKVSISDFGVSSTHHLFTWYSGILVGHSTY